MSEQIQMQKVGHKDIRHVIELLKDFSEINDVKIMKLLEARVASDQHLILMGKVGTESAGILECTIEQREALCGNSRIGNISTLFVKEEFRRKGVASHLMDTAKFWFKGADLEAVECRAKNDDAALVGFLEKYEFSAQWLTFTKVP